MSNRKSATPANESPLWLSELSAIFPDVPPEAIAHLTHTHCAPHEAQAEGPGRRRHAKYLPSEVAAAVRKWKQKRRPAGAESSGYVENRVQWIPRPLVKELVDPATADAWAMRELIREPRLEFVEGLIAPVKFWPKADIEGQLSDSDKTLKQRTLPVRTPTAIKAMDRSDYINEPEANSIGFTRFYLLEHTEFPPKPIRPATPAQMARRKKQGQKLHVPTPATPIGRFIKGRWEEVISRRNGRGHRIQSPAWNVGDLLDILAMRDNPPIVATGGKFLRDAVPLLNQMGIKIGATTLRELIDAGKIVGGTVDAFKKNFAPEKMWWMKWDKSEWDKLRGTVEVDPVHQKLDAIHTDVRDTKNSVHALKDTQPKKIVGGISVGEAATLTGVHKGQISRAKIEDNGLRGPDRRLCPRSLIEWLKGREDRPESIAAVEALFARAEQKK